MKKTIGVLLLGMMMFGVGCEKKTETEGGPGATRPPSEKPALGETPGTFTLKTAMTAIDIQQGESDTVTIEIDRADNFRQDVTISFEQVPAGLTFDPMSPVIKHGDGQVEVMAKTAPDAAAGEFVVKVKGHPATGPDATTDLKIHINPK